MDSYHNAKLLKKLSEMHKYTCMYGCVNCALSTIVMEEILLKQFYTLQPKNRQVLAPKNI